jgi:TonB family protein
MKVSRSWACVCLALGLVFSQARGEKPPESTSTDKLPALIFKPSIVYPYEARRAWMSGRGIVVVDINSETGEVIAARMGRSTGHALLDKAATDAFRTARFRKGTAPRIKIPIAFTLSGGGRVSYERKSKNMDDVLARFLGKGTVLKGPIPEYPAYRDWGFKSGKGVFELHANKEGQVDAVKILKSTGDDIFDRAAVKTLGKWRLRRGPLVLELPLRFQLTPTDFSVQVAR